MVELFASLFAQALLDPEVNEVEISVERQGEWVEPYERAAAVERAPVDLGLVDEPLDDPVGFPAATMVRT